MKLYSYKHSGNSWKVRLMLSFLGLDYQLIETTTTVTTKEGEKPGVLNAGFLKLNPKAQVPVLVDGEKVISDSAAICTYLAKKYDEKWFPNDPKMESKVIYWLVTSANEISNTLAKARRVILYGDDDYNLEICHRKGYEILHVIERGLKDGEWLIVGDEPTIADIACYPYIKLCPEGRMSLEKYPGIKRWMRGFENLTGYVDLEH